MGNDNPSDGLKPAEENAPVTEQERKVLVSLRKLDFGEVRVIVKKSEIVQIEVTKSVKI
jgi:hypothetical protein